MDLTGRSVVKELTPIAGGTMLNAMPINKGLKGIYEGRKDAQLLVRVDPSIKEALQELARKNDRTLKGEVTRALRNYLLTMGVTLPSKP